ncbi:MAG: hypothetical protein LBV47_04110 [Bacteroidales bacterium]|jgi:hypothetical protein|nr:hypothetical protein [Bacteroidales bacterium]
MTVKSKTYADRMNNAQIMSTALRANLEMLKKRGMTDEFIITLNKSLESIARKNSDQERLKAELKAITTEKETIMEQLHLQMKEAIKVVKLEVPQSLWKEYGIADKR